MEGKKAALGILDYSCSQPSLEQIFLQIAERDINRRAAPVAHAVHDVDEAAGGVTA